MLSYRNVGKPKTHVRNVVMYLATLRPRPHNVITLSIYHLEDCKRQKDNRGDSYHLLLPSVELGTALVFN